MIPWKKILQWILFLGITALICLVFYLVFFYKPNSEPIVSQPVTPGGLTPAAAGNNNNNTTGGTVTPGLVVVAPTPTTNPVNPLWLTNDANDLVGYDEINGAFFRINDRGQVIPLADSVFYNLRNVVWSQDRNQAVLEYNSGIKTLYNFQTKKSISVPSDWTDFSFAPNGKTIAFKKLSSDTNEQYLATIDSAGTNVKFILPLGDNEDRVNVAWSPDGNTLGFITVPQDGVHQELTAIDPQGNERAMGYISGINFKPIWSPDNSAVLYSTAMANNYYRPALWLLPPQSATATSTHIRIPLETTANECVFTKNNQTIICAVPLGQGSSGWGLSNDNKLNVPSRLDEYNLVNGSVRTIYRPDNLDIVDSPVLSNNDRSLYFVNRTTNQLQKINLSQ